MKDCKAIKKDGTQCGANTMNDSEYCYFHNPEVSEEERKQGYRKGGRNRALTVGEPLREIRVESGEDIFTLLRTTINEVRAGELDTKVANTIGYLSGMMLKAYEKAQLEERIINLENALRR